jgi:hypothetical protein
MGPEARVIGEAGCWRRGPVAERACKPVAAREDGGWAREQRAGWRWWPGNDGRRTSRARMVGAQAVGRVGV